MKNLLIYLLVIGVMGSSCASNRGCPANGKSIGAERLLSPDAKTQKLVKKAGKFKA